MPLIFQCPIMIKVTVVFGLILVMIRRKYSLGTSVLFGSILLGLWCQMNILDLIVSMGKTVIHPTTLLLDAVVVLILILSHSMDKLKQMQRLLTSFQGLVQNTKFNLIVFPALIGLLPMPGGAIFSAPMVDEIAKDHQLDAETKSMLNYWFRHVWEPSWPLYAGTLLTVSLASISLWAFISRTIVLTALMILAGYIFLLRNISLNPMKQAAGERPKGWLFAKELIPILLVVAGAALGKAILTVLQRPFPIFTDTPTEVPLVIALIFSVLFVWKSNHASAEDIRAILLDKAIASMIYMITAIYIFKDVLTNSRAIDEMSGFLSAQHIPLMLIVILLPFLVAVVSGISVAFVGTTFPVLISLFHTVHPHGDILPYLVLGFCAGFLGVMFSPLHVCLIFTQEYFKADFRLLYHRLWKPSAMVLGGTLVYFSLLVMFG